MKKKNGSKGFTLIEMLVVVLIIGVLAAVSLSQYKKAVAKSKAAQLQTAIASVANSVENFYLVQGSYPRSLDDLDIEINLPTTNGLDARFSVTCGKNLVSYSHKRGDDFEISLYDLGIDHRYLISAHFINGKYKCRGFVHYLSGYGNKDGSTYCGEHYYNRSCGTDCEPGIFCEDVMNMQKIGPGTDLMDIYR